MENWRYFWAKTDRENPESEWVHPLWAHLMDVGNVALLLWEENHLPQSLKMELSQALNLSEKETGHFIALWIGFHDLGKAIPSFQAQHEPSRRLFKENTPLFIQDVYTADKRLAHGHASILILENWLRKEQKSEPLLKEINHWIGFHHGNLANKDKVRSGGINLGGNLWKEEQSLLLEAVYEAWQQVYPFSFPEELQEEEHPAWLLGFAGFVTLADWLGSMGEYFSDTQVQLPKDSNLAEYIHESRQNAKKALQEVGFSLPSQMQLTSFEALFPALSQYPQRPLQSIAQTLPLNDVPALIIVEAPTGEGKTEAAFILANRQQALINNGIYVAMPTQAMSNGLFGRFKSFLEQSHTDKDVINLRLVHGNDFLNEAQQALVFSPSWTDIAIEENDQGFGKAEVKTAKWFMPKKRALLAKYGIGTIDQALLSVLPAKHFFLRLFGLAGKTIIFDEVHAYDTYMNQLLFRLIEWLKALNCNVILLSATLPSNTRLQLMKAWHKNAALDVSLAPYPCLWHSQNPEPHAFEHDKSREQKAILNWKPDDLAQLVLQIEEAYQKGATIAIIVNLVDRAQQLYSLLNHLTDVYLFHARFPFAKRQKIENTVLERFGKDRLQKPSILIATQVAEASLDLDFDVMFSDLAPVDLLLQRAGRLQRHQRERPLGFEQPIFNILCDTENELPKITEISGYEHVYAPITLWKTYFALKDKPEWHLPFDYRPLIEAVYDENTESPSHLSEDAKKVWENKGMKLWKEEEKEMAKANTAKIYAPQQSEYILTGNQLEDDENLAVAEHFRAVTRLGDSATVICLFVNEEGKLFWDIAYATPFEISIFQDLEKFQKKPLPFKLGLVRKFFYNSLSLSAKDVLKALRKSHSPDWWENVTACLPSLKYHYPLIFIDRCWEEGDSRPIIFSESQGLIIRKVENP